MSSWKSYVIISGGLTFDEQILDDIIQNDTASNSGFEMRKIRSNVRPRYAHTCHVIEDTLILIGGVDYSDSPPGICFINLNTFEATEFEMPVSFLIEF